MMDGCDKVWMMEISSDDLFRIVLPREAGPYGEKPNCYGAQSTENSGRHWDPGCTHTPTITSARGQHTSTETRCMYGMQSLITHIKRGLRKRTDNISLSPARSLTFATFRSPRRQQTQGVNSLLGTASPASRPCLLLPMNLPRRRSANILVRRSISKPSTPGRPN